MKRNPNFFSNEDLNYVKGLKKLLMKLIKKVK